MNVLSKTVGSDEDRSDHKRSSLISTAESGRLSVTEERLSVQVEEREMGSVRVRTVTHKELKDVPVVLQSKSVHIDRIPKYRFVDAEYGPRQEGDTLIVPVFEYVPVTDMKLMLKEEIRITSIVSEQHSVHQAEVQRQDVVVERRTGVTGEWIAEAAIDPVGTGERSAL